MKVALAIARGLIMGALLAVLLLVLAVRFLPAPAGGNSPAQAGPTLKVDLGDNNGSAVHIGGGLVLSAWHVVKDTASVTVVTDAGARLEAEVLWTAQPYDVALLRLPVDAWLGSVDVSCRPMVVGEEITAHGTPARVGMSATAWGRVAADPAPFFIWREVVTAHGIGDSAGMSGGPVLDAAGLMVGLYVGQVPKSPYAFVVPATVICELLAR